MIRHFPDQLLDARVLSRKTQLTTGVDLLVGYHLGHRQLHSSPMLQDMQTYQR